MKALVSALCVAVSVCAVPIDAVVGTFPYYESFESGLGVWQPSPGNDFDWTRNTGETPSSGTGPQRADDGLWYIYTEASGNNPAQTAAVQAAFDLSALSQPAVSFYYHMYGSTMGALYIDVDNGTTFTTLWEMVGEQQAWSTAAWRRAEVNLSTYAGQSNVTIRIRGVTGNSYTSDMAVDKVQVYDDVPRVDVDPSRVDGTGIPGGNVNYTLSVINRTGGAATFDVRYINNPWATLGPVMVGPLANGASAPMTVQAQIPPGTLAGDSATSVVEVISGGFTGTAALVTVCRWTTYPLPCETWDIFPHGWTNYYQADTTFGWLESGIGNPPPGLYHPAYTAFFSNWFVSPAVDLSDSFAESLELAFDEFVLIQDGYDYTGVLLSLGSRDPGNGDFFELLELGGSSLSWTRRKVDLTSYLGTGMAYLAFLYVGSNSHLPFIDNVCVRGERVGIDQAFYDLPAAATAECAQAGVTFSGRVWVDGQSGSSGPVAGLEAQLGIGFPGTDPRIDGSWRWYPAPYTGPSTFYDVHKVTPTFDAVGQFDVCMRYRIGQAAWAYADRHGVLDGYDPAFAGHLTVLPRTIPGATIYRQTMDAFGWWESVVYSNAVPAPQALIADNIDLSVDTRIEGLRWHGVYGIGDRRGDARGFLVRIFGNALSNTAAAFDHPGPVVYEHFHPGLACEFMFTNLFGIPHYEYQLALPSPWSLGPGRYWLAIQMVAVSNGFEWYWLSSDDPVRGSSALVEVTGTWVDVSTDLGFELTGMYENYGVLSGTVTSARSGAPLNDAHIVARGLTGITARTGANGRYNMLLPLGLYSIEAGARHYVTGQIGNILFTSAGEYREIDFSLNGSLLAHTPPKIEEILRPGEVRTNSVTVTNSGPLQVHYRTGFTDVSADTGGTVVVSTRAPGVRVPRFTGTLPPSREPHSIGPPPTDTTLGALPLPDSITATLVPTAYGTEIQNTELFSFPLFAPASDTTLGSYGDNSIWASDFMPNDFGTLYAIRDNNEFVTIVASNAAVTVHGLSVPSHGLSWTGMAADRDGTLFACATDLDRTELYRIDPYDGYATVVGVISNSPCTIAIAIDSHGTMYGHDIVNDSLLRIDKYSAVGTVIGPLGFDANFGQGMDYDDYFGILYLAAFNQATGPELRVADVTTGATSNIGAFAVGQVGSMAVALSNSPLWVTSSSNSGSAAPGGTTSFDVVFDSTAVPCKGSYEARLVFSGDFVNDRPCMPLIMHVADGPQLSTPAEVYFGPTLVNTKKHKPFTAKNTGFGAITGSLAGIQTPFGIDGQTNYLLDQLEGIVFDAWFMPTGPGEFTNVLELSGAGGQSVRLVGGAAPTLAHTPLEVNFADTVIDETNVQIVLCENIGGGTVVGSVGACNPPFHIAGQTSYALNYGDRSYFTVTFVPRGFGYFQQDVVLSGGGDPTLSFSGQGVPEPLLALGLWCAALLCAARRRN